MPQLSLPARPPLTPAEEFAALKAPWQRCTWCGTTRAPSSLDAEGACIDEDWCMRQLTVISVGEFRDARLRAEKPTPGEVAL
jgi:hypothetical protein